MVYRGWARRVEIFIVLLKKKKKKSIQPTMRTKLMLAIGVIVKEVTVEMSQEGSK